MPFTNNPICGKYGLKRSFFSMPVNYHDRHVLDPCTMQAGEAGQMTEMTYRAEQAYLLRIRCALVAKQGGRF